MDLHALTTSIKSHEGLKLSPYRCPAGHWTIGYGHNIENDPPALQARYREGIILDEAEAILARDIGIAQRAAERIFIDFARYTDTRQAVIVEMLFNLGAARFLEFKRTIAAIKGWDWEEAAGEMLDSDWARQVGGRARQLALWMEEGHAGQDRPEQSRPEQSRPDQGRPEQGQPVAGNR